VISEAGWDHFKVLPQPNVSTIIEAIYGPDLILTPSPDIEMAVDIPEAEEVAFTLVTNKKCKRKDKFLLFIPYLPLTLEAIHHSFYRLSSLQSCKNSSSLKISDNSS